MNQNPNSHTDSPTGSTQWIDDWLKAQQGWLAQWQATVAPPTGIDMELLRRQFGAASFDTTNGVQSFQSLLQAGLAQFGQMAAGGGDATWQQLLQSFEQTFAHAFAPSFSLGPLREQQTAWQEYTRALTDYEARQRSMFEHYGKVFAQSLDRTREWTAQRSAQGQPVNHLRELYEAWIDCGEQTFAQLAHDPTFITAQADSANALSRLKVARNVLFEHWLRAQDLPTRSELNSVHLRLRELTARVMELEQQLRAANSSQPTE